MSKKFLSHRFFCNLKKNFIYFLNENFVEFRLGIERKQEEEDGACIIIPHALTRGHQKRRRRRRKEKERKTQHAIHSPINREEKGEEGIKNGATSVFTLPI